MKFLVGEDVIMHTLKKGYKPGDSNPLGMHGKVTRVQGDTCWVKWDNGRENAYIFSDLQLYFDEQNSNQQTQEII